MKGGGAPRHGRVVMVAAASAAATLVLGAVLLHWIFDLPIHRFAESWALRISWLGTMMSFLAVGIIAVINRSWSEAVLVLGLIMGAAVAGLAAAQVSEEVLRLGEGEQVVWERAGSMIIGGNPPPITYVAEVEYGCRMRLGEEEMDLEAGTWSAAVGGIAVRVDRIAPAPYFALRDGGGRTLHEGLVKVDDRAGENLFIRVGILPHRFYLSHVPGRSTGSSATPDTLRLRVQRGKLLVVDAEVRKGEPHLFEGLVFHFDDGSSWAAVSVRQRPRSAPVVVAAFVILVGLALVVSDRVRR